ncbi:DNA gyrase inhibitor YacG [Azospirillum thermophilum]|uniref:DNA gyrase inhibitor YacG n=1 Tax=Azospirillum thermophilum TaxID=2202148 RepID=A0A2S2CVU2_9PROT|nr:DNA gyrase inhibitor YacG [Azospirillum thermophilum]AWK88654.1 DNA gyrase inhibitor YacG [Azospirillum thermophilum]
MTTPSPTPPATAAGTCPICGRPSVTEVKPFCSKRCADVDLSRWLGGVYRIEGSERPDPAANDADPEAE